MLRVHTSLVACIVLQLVDCAFYSRFSQNSLSDVVDTQYGRVQGQRLVLKDDLGTVDFFMGIPFAAPPIGSRRFRHPEPPASWEDIYSATTPPAECPQDLSGGGYGATALNPSDQHKVYSEDCLYLNVFVPVTGSKGKAVMLWVHGGGFKTGGLSLYDARYLAALNDVIVVSIAYRLGALGYINLGHPEAPGNAAMLDQVMGMKWVQNNIANFGGDPSRVTLWGESSGAANVGVHLVSPVSAGLFSQAIIESGAGNTYYASMSGEVNIQRSFQLASILGCEFEETSDVIACMASRPTSAFLENQDISGLENSFRTSVDGYFLTEPPRDSIKNGKFHKVPLLAGVNKNEGTFILFFSLFDYLGWNANTMNSTQFIDSMYRLFTDFPSYPEGLSEAGMDALLFEYTNWEDKEDKERNIAELDNAVADAFFRCGVQSTSDAFANAGLPVYAYEFTHRYENHIIPEWMGVMHTDELHMLFGIPYIGAPLGIVFTEEEKQLSSEMMKHWSNFAKTGDPTRDGNGEVTSSKWPIYTVESRDYKELNYDVLYEDESLRSGPLRSHQCALFDWYLPKVEEACQK